MRCSQTGFPRLGAADLRTWAKARENRMWKIEFTKQLGIGLIYIPHTGASQRERELKKEWERKTYHGGSLRGQNKWSVQLCVTAEGQLALAQFPRAFCLCIDSSCEFTYPLLWPLHCEQELLTQGVCVCVWVNFVAVCLVVKVSPFVK